MLGRLLVVPLLTLPMSAEDQAAAARVAAGCGPNEVQFEVKTDKKQHPVAQPEAGKALVYVFGDEDSDNVALHIGGAINRVGLDGAWVGANDMKSYFFFSVGPGGHRLCTSRQSKLEGRTKISAATSFTAEAGSVYYFRTETPVHPLPTEQVKLVPVDPAAAQLLVAVVVVQHVSSQEVTGSEPRTWIRRQ